MFPIIELLIFAMAFDEHVHGQVWSNRDPMPLILSSASYDDRTEMENKTSNSTKPIFRFVSFVDYSMQYFDIGPTSALAYSLALKRLEAMGNILPNYKLEIEAIDGNCYDPTIIKKLIEALEQNSAAPNRVPLLGINECPMTSQRLSAMIITHYNVVGYTAAAQHIDLFERRHKYPNYFSMGERSDYLAIGLAKFVKAMGWRRVAIVSDNEAYNQMVESLSAKWLEYYDIAVVHLLRFNVFTQDEYELSSGFKELAARQPRIIVLLSATPVTFACYMHYNGMSGPNYVIIFASVYYDEVPLIPPVASAWCTKEMALDILNGAFIPDTFGATLSDIYGPTYREMSGLTKEDFRAIAQRKLEHTFFFDGFFPFAYDRIIVAASVLNQTEASLNKRNMTLLDWSTNSALFKSNGQEAVKLLKNGFFNIPQVLGIRGDYSFNATTEWSSGAIPITFRQAIVTSRNGTYLRSFTTIGYYKGNLPPSEQLKIYSEKVTWRTFDKRVPRDAIEIQSYAVASFNLPVNIVIKIIGAFLFVALLSAHYKLVRKQKTWLTVKFKGQLLSASVGLILMLATVFALPIGVETTYSCFTTCLLVWAGFSLFLLALYHLLNSKSSGKISPIDGDFKGALQCIFINLAYSFVQAALLAVSLLTGDGFTVTAVRLPLEMSSFDSSLAFAPFRMDCQIIGSLVGSKNILPSAISIIAACFQAVLLVKTAAAAIVKQSSDKQRRATLANTRRVSQATRNSVARPPVDSHRKPFATFFYGFGLVLLAGAFIGFLFGEAYPLLGILVMALSLAMNFAYVSLLVFLHRKQELIAPNLSTTSTKRQSIQLR